MIDLSRHSTASHCHNVSLPRTGHVSRSGPWNPGNLGILNLESCDLVRVATSVIAGTDIEAPASARAGATRDGMLILLDRV